MLAMENSPPASKQKTTVEVIKPKPEAKLSWKSMQATVADAKSASERLLRDASRYVQKIREAKDDRHHG